MTTYAKNIVAVPVTRFPYQKPQRQSGHFAFDDSATDQPQKLPREVLKQAKELASQLD